MEYGLAFVISLAVAALLIVVGRIAWPSDKPVGASKPRQREQGGTDGAEGHDYTGESSGGSITSTAEAAAPSFVAAGGAFGGSGATDGWDVSTGDAGAGDGD
jgi:hypothetical protein